MRKKIEDLQDENKKLESDYKQAMNECEDAKDILECIRNEKEKFENENKLLKIENERLKNEFGKAKNGNEEIPSNFSISTPEMSFQIGKHIKNLSVDEIENLSEKVLVNESDNYRTFHVTMPSFVRFEGVEGIL